MSGAQMPLQSKKFILSHDQVDAENSTEESENDEQDFRQREIKDSAQSQEPAPHISCL